MSSVSSSSGTRRARCVSAQARPPSASPCRPSTSVSRCMTCAPAPSVDREPALEPRPRGDDHRQFGEHRRAWSPTSMSMIWRAGSPGWTSVAEISHSSSAAPSSTRTCKAHLVAADKVGGGLHDGHAPRGLAVVRAADLAKPERYRPASGHHAALVRADRYDQELAAPARPGARVLELSGRGCDRRRACAGWAPRRPIASACPARWCSSWSRTQSATGARPRGAG